MAKKTLMDDFMEMDEAKNLTGTTELAELMPVSMIQVSETFESLFPLDEDMVEEIAEKMRKSGYDNSQPVHVWKEKGITIDGHTRLAASKLAELFEIPVYKHSFANENEAVLYALSLQLDRRNLTPQDMLNVAERYIELGGQKNIKALKKKLSSSLNVSAKTAERLLAISKDETASKELKEGGSIGGTYNSLMERLHPENHEKVEEEKEENLEEKKVEDDFETFDSLGDEQEEVLEETNTTDETNYEEDEILKDELDEKENEKQGEEKNYETVKETKLKATTEKMQQDKGPADGSWSYAEADVKERAFCDGWKTAFFYVLSMIIKGNTPEEIYSWCNEEGELTPSAVKGLKASDADIKEVKTLCAK